MRFRALDKHNWIVSAALIVVAAAVVTARVNSAEFVRLGEQNAPVGEIMEIEIPTPSLEGNLLGDPTEQPISIYLPPSYSIDNEKRFPVLYLLHGFTGTNRTWLTPADAKPREPTNDGQYGQASMLNRERLDSVFAADEVQEFIIVAPNGRNAYKHSFWVNSSVAGNWEDYVVRDVVGFVDSNFRTIDNGASRGIAGHSGGGNGAIFIAMRHSEMFGSVYAMAPCCLGPMYSLPSLTNGEDGELTPFWTEVFSRIGEIKSVEDLPGAFGDRPQDFWVNAEFSAGAAYSPNPGRPPFFSDYLYEFKDGKLLANERAIQSRLSLASYHLIDQHADDLRSLRGLMIDFGEFEMPSLVSGNAKFVEALAARRIPFTLHVYKDGDHGNLVASRLESEGLQFFSEHLDFEPN